jgi:hypothetical protein
LPFLVRARQSLQIVDDDRLSLAADKALLLQGGERPHRRLLRDPQDVGQLLAGKTEGHPTFVPAGHR